MSMIRPPVCVLHIVEATQTGVGRHVRDLIRLADRRRFAPALCCSLERSDQHFRAAVAELKRGGTPVYAIPMHRALRPLANLRAVTAIRRLLRREGFAVVHVHSAIAGMLGRLSAKRLKGTAVIYTPNGWPFLSTRDRRFAQVYRALERRAAAWCDRIICVSRHERELGLKHRIAPAEKFTVIPNGIDVGRVRGSRSQARAALGLPAGAVVLGTVTRFAYQKDPLGLITALAPLLRTAPRCILVLVGDGPLRRRAEALAHTLGVARQTTCTGFRTDATELMFGFDVFLLPSRYEGLSYALLEAMAAGLPVITSSGGGEDAITDGENGFIIPPGDATQLRKATERLIADRGLREAMGQRNRQKVLQFSVTEQVHRTEALYDRLLEQKTRSHLNHHL